MTFQYCSDPHLESPTNKRCRKANPIKPEGEILLLAGDIILVKSPDQTYGVKAESY